MISKEQTHEEDAGELHEKLQQLRSITNSHAQSETSIILDATHYIQQLKQKIEVLNLDIEAGETSRHDQYWPEVVVETLDNGYSVNIQCSEKSSPSLLVSIIAVFEELGLNVMEARASCTDSFQLEAFGKENEENGEKIDAQVVKEAISDAIRNWREINGQE